jgi:predicted ArsR family transcriptional regulator
VTFVERARPVALKLGRFTLSELGHALGVKRSEVVKHLDALEVHGIIRPTDEHRYTGKAGRPARIYVQAILAQSTWRALHAEPAPVVNRERRVPVEIEVVRQEVKRKPSRGKQTRQRRRVRVKDNTTREVVRAAQRLGYEVGVTQNGHYAILNADGHSVASVSKGRLDPRAGMNLRAQLRREGVAV